MKALVVHVLMASLLVVGSQFNSIPPELTSAAVSTLPSVPLARVLPFKMVLPKDVPTAVRLDADVRIPDGGVLTWPVSLPYGDPDSDANVTALKVHLRGLYHSDARDLRMQLWHQGRGTTFVDGARPGIRIGSAHVPDVANPSHSSLVTAINDELSLVGRGADIVVEDVSHGATNLALGAMAAQSSTLLSAGAELAVDGDGNGYFSGASVAHTGEFGVQDPEAWWEADIRGAANASEASNASAARMTHGDAIVRTVRLWGRALAPDRDEIQSVRVSSPGQISGGSFRLRFLYNGVNATTPPIHPFAVAMRSDEVLGGSPGQRPGESMEEALLSIAMSGTEQLVGSVRVTRSLPDAYGAYTWTVTFLTATGDLPLLEPVDVAIAALGNAATVTVSQIVAGSSSTTYNYVTNSGTEKAIVQGTLMGAWVMLLEAPLGASATLSQARAAALWSRQITASMMRDPESRVVTLAIPDTVSITAAATAAALSAATDGDPETAHRGGRVGAIRVQLSELGHLAIAEVEAFPRRLRTLNEFPGSTQLVGRDAPAAMRLSSSSSILPDNWPSPKASRTVHSQETFAGILQPSQLRQTASDPPKLGGQWVLTISDLNLRRVEPLRLRDEASVANAPGSRPWVMRHGAGALSGWVLNATLSDGRWRVIRADVSFEVEFLPAYHSVALADTPQPAGGADVAAAMNLTVGSSLDPDSRTLRRREPCGVQGVETCLSSFGTGTLTTTDDRGEARPLGTHRVLWKESDHRVVLTPASGFSGDDLLQYKAWVGGSVSDPQKVSLSTRECRQVQLASERRGAGPRADSAQTACNSDATPDLAV
jgi:hypothetical protein